MVAAGLLLLVLAACVPGARIAEGPSVIVVNGPRENAVPDLADALERLMQAQTDCCLFELQWSQPVRAQERQRDLYGYRAWIAAAGMARNLGADWALLIGSHGYERTVTQHGDQLHITVTTGVRLHVTDGTGGQLAMFGSRQLRAERTQPAAQELVSEGNEPLLVSLASEALADVAGQAVSWLNAQVNGLSAEVVPDDLLVLEGHVATGK